MPLTYFQMAFAMLGVIFLGLGPIMTAIDIFTCISIIISDEMTFAQMWVPGSNWFPGIGVFIYGSFGLRLLLCGKFDLNPMTFNGNEIY